MEEKKEYIKRQVAYKLPINTITTGVYKKSADNINYLLLNGKYKVSRVNIMGIVISKTEQNDSGFNSLEVDDSSEKISIRIFGENTINNYNEILIGDPVMVIGKVREFNSQIYLIPEIIKKVENKIWFQIRKKEIENNNLDDFIDIEKNIEENKEKEIIDYNIKKNEEIILEEKEKINKEENPFDKYLNTIKELDKKDGANTEEVIKKINDLGEEGEKIINILLKQGEIFEIKAGKIKVLG